MTIKSLRLTLVLALLMPQSYAFQPVSTTHNNIIVTAQAMSAGECLDTFYQDMHDKHVYPIVLAITNNSGNAVVLSSDRTKILNADILTPKKIDAEISAYNTGTFFLVITMVLMPLALATSSLAKDMKMLKPIIERFSFSDTPITIEPGTTFKTIAFAKFNYPKDAEGKTLSYVAPKHLNMSIELRPNSWFNFSPANSIELTIPTTAAQ